MCPTSFPTLSITQSPTQSPTISPYSPDRYPTGGILIVIIVIAFFYCICIFALYKCARLKSKDDADELEKKNRKRYGKTDQRLPEEGIDILFGDIELQNYNNHLHLKNNSTDDDMVDYSEGVDNEADTLDMNRMKTTDELFLKKIIKQQEFDEKEKKESCDELFSQQLKEFVTVQKQKTDEIFEKMANDGNKSDSQEIRTRGDSGSGAGGIFTSFSNFIRSHNNNPRTAPKTTPRTVQNHDPIKINKSYNPIPPKFVNIPSISNNGHQSKYKQVNKYHFNTLE